MRTCTRAAAWANARARSLKIGSAKKGISWCVRVCVCILGERPCTGREERGGDEEIVFPSSFLWKQLLSVQTGDGPVMKGQKWPGCQRKVMKIRFSHREKGKL